MRQPKTASELAEEAKECDYLKTPGRTPPSIYAVGKCEGQEWLIKKLKSLGAWFAGGDPSAVKNEATTVAPDVTKEEGGH